MYYQNEQEIRFPKYQLDVSFSFFNWSFYITKGSYTRALDNKPLEEVTRYWSFLFLSFELRHTQHKTSKS